MATTTQNQRLDVRLRNEQKKLIEQAAGYLGQSISAFTTATLVREAQEVVERFGTVRLTDRDRDIFLDLLDNPPKPNAKLRKAVRQYNRKVGQ